MKCARLRPTRVRPVDHDRTFRRRVGEQCVDQRHHAEIERAPRRAQRLVRFQHHGEFGEIKATDIDQRTGALPGRDRYRMGERISHFSQAHR